MREMNENINQLNKIIYMRRLLLLIFAFVSFVGINVGRAQSALPYEINFGDSQDGLVGCGQQYDAGHYVGV